MSADLARKARPLEGRTERSGHTGEITEGGVGGARPGRDACRPEQASGGSQSRAERSNHDAERCWGIVWELRRVQRVEGEMSKRSASLLLLLPDIQISFPTAEDRWKSPICYPVQLAQPGPEHPRGADVAVETL